MKPISLFPWKISKAKLTTVTNKYCFLFYLKRLNNLEKVKVSTKALLLSCVALIISPKASFVTEMSVCYYTPG